MLSVRLLKDSWDSWSTYSCLFAYVHIHNLSPMEWYLDLLRMAYLLTAMCVIRDQY